jgi:hypothetical protein
MVTSYVLYWDLHPEESSITVIYGNIQRYKIPPLDGDRIATAITSTNITYSALLLDDILCVAGTIVGDLDVITFNPIASNILKWLRFKFV